MNHQEQLIKMKAQLIEMTYQTSDLLRVIKRMIKTPPTYPIRENHKTYRKIDYWISRGMQKQEAIELIASDLGKSRYDLEYSYNQFHKRSKAMERYAQRYFIKILRKNDFKMDKIAVMLGISTVHAYRLLNEKIPYFDEI